MSLLCLGSYLRSLQVELNDDESIIALFIPEHQVFLKIFNMIYYFSMDNSNFEIISFYKFINLKLINKLKDELYIICKKNSILGTVILSKEGVNGMLAGSKDSIELITSFLSNTVF